MGVCAAGAQQAASALPNARGNPYLVRTLIDGHGNQIDEIAVPGRPPAITMPAVQLPKLAYGVIGTLSVNSLNNVPAFRWCYGCSATSAGMLFGYYDNSGFFLMYTGIANSGVCPMNNNATWGFTTYPSVTCAECPFVASHLGVEGRSTRGHVDDYWIDYNNASPDPYITGSWTQHSPQDSTADFMGTNQSAKNNTDGSTTFYNYPNGSLLSDYTGGEPTDRDGCHGMRLFAESRGYQVTTNYSQYIYGYNGNTQGFTFAQFQAEIDAGHPVLIQLEGHTMLGFGYDSTSSIVYIHDTWDNLNHTMTWGGSYGGMLHYGVTVIHVALNVSAGVSATAGTYTDRVRVTWNAVTGAADYCVYRAASSGGAKTAISGWQSGTTFDDTTAISGTTYYYWVTAATDAGGSNESGYSSYTSGYMDVAPSFSNIAASPSPAGVGATVSLTFTASKALSLHPAVAVNAHTASYVRKSSNNYTYSYTIQASEANGAATIVISGTDSLGNTGATTNTTALMVNNQVTLTVNSAYGGASPGTVVLGYGARTTQWVANSPVSGGVGTQYLCFGASVAGNVFTQDSITNVTLTLTNNATLTWKWQTNYWLHVDCGANGSAMPSDIWFGCGSNIQVTATPAGYYSVAGWGGQTNGGVLSGNRLAITMDAPRTIQVWFGALLATNSVPQWWLAQYGLTNGGFDAGALLDSDNDGMPNWEEYIAGTDPTNAASALRIVAIGPDSVTFAPAFTNRIYAVFCATNLVSADWVPLSAYEPGTGAVRALFATNNAPQIFYRIGVQMP